MPRQQVGNPKFYIDMLSYWKAKGIMTAIGDAGLNIDQHYPSQIGYIPSLVGLNPSDYYRREIFPHDLGYSMPANIPDIQAQLNRTVNMSDNNTDKLFFGILGHNFNDYDEVGLEVSGLDINGDETFNSNTDLTLTEICNFIPPMWSDLEKPRFNGWSITEMSGAAFRDIRRVKFDFHIILDYPPIPHFYLGSLCFGHVYQMPHSPDLKLTMKREYDGIQDQNTKGGSTLTHISYAGAPDWVLLPAWELSTAPITQLDFAGVKEPRSPSRGRRIWTLSFSYIELSDMFSVNELYGMGNPTDSDTNTNAGYDSEDFTLGGDFELNSEMDTSFVSRILDKTIGGALPFIFQPDGNNNSPDQFAICKLDQGSIDIKQVANQAYTVKLNIREVW